jgi:hypothetical protein
MAACDQQDQTGSTPSESKAPETQTTKVAAAQAAEAKAQALFEQFRKMMAENKWDQADATLTQLESMKSSLTQELRDEIDNARAGFQAAKSMNAGEGAPGR